MHIYIYIHTYIHLYIHTYIRIFFDFRPVDEGAGVQDVPRLHSPESSLRFRRLSEISVRRKQTCYVGVRLKSLL